VSPLRANGTFAEGTFAGGPKLRAACETLGDVVVVADVLDLSPTHMQRVFDGSAPMPMVARYSLLLEALLWAGAPLEARLLYTWQRDDAATWRSTSGVTTTKVDER
jgi:hypothetical protein